MRLAQDMKLIGLFALGILPVTLILANVLTRCEHAKLDATVHNRAIEAGYADSPRPKDGAGFRD